MVTKRLVLSFQNAAGRTSSISVSNPRESLTADEVKQVMNQVISSNVFQTNGGDLVAIGGARVVAQDVTELEVL